MHINFWGFVLLGACGTSAAIAAAVLIEIAKAVPRFVAWICAHG